MKSYKEARAFWAEYIKLAHPDDNPADIPNLGESWVKPWKEARLYCDPWRLMWSENFDLLPDLRVGDRVKSWQGVGEIGFIYSSSTGQPIQAKLNLDDGSRSKFNYVDKLERGE